MAYGELKPCVLYLINLEIYKVIQNGSSCDAARGGVFSVPLRLVPDIQCPNRLMQKETAPHINIYICY